MSFYHFVLGASALGAASGLSEMGAASTTSAQAAMLDSISRAVLAGVLPPPPKHPGMPPPPKPPLFSNSLVRHQHHTAMQHYNAAMQQFEIEIMLWHRVVAMTLGFKR